MNRYLGVMLVLLGLLGGCDLSQSEVVAPSGSICNNQGDNNTGIISGCEGENSAIEGSGTVTRESRSTSPFSKISASGVLTVHLTPSSDRVVEIAAEDHLLPRVQTTVRDSILNISLVGRNIKITKPIEIYVSAPSISSLRASGQVTVVGTTQYDRPEISIEAEGQSKILLDGWSVVRSDKISASGQSIVRVSVDKEIVSLNASGQGRIKIFGLDKASKIEADGQSEIELEGAPQIDEADVSGQAKLQYF